MEIIHLPTLNAILNALSATLLLIGWRMIRLKKIDAHKVCMISATVTSTLFLTSYLYYHYNHGRTIFEGVPLIRTVYLAILLTHTILAVAVPPLALTTLYFAFSQNWSRHKQVARITFPIWLYVSFTGVVVYYMLYQM